MLIYRNAEGAHGQKKFGNTFPRMSKQKKLSGALLQTERQQGRTFNEICRVHRCACKEDRKVRKSK